ncbi:MAG: hypothetical protein NC299_11965 [Lachnospiraceae bacterium]|nr:hypothetical protein [Lachnospiraceae bacterium]
MNLKSGLSVGGIQRLINEVERYRKDLKKHTNRMLSDLVSKGAEFAREECPIRTGELYSSIVGIVDNSEGKGFIRVNCPYAIYVEMGTGIKGANAPHPDKSIIGFNFEYDRNGHGVAGWWYPTDEKDPNPTKYTAKNGQMYAWTGGMPSRPFMYNAAQKLKDELRR